MPRIDFIADDSSPENPFEPVPPDQYAVEITSSEKKETKKGDGWYLELFLRIAHGPYTGNLIRDRLVLEHPNPTCVEIAHARLTEICQCLGMKGCEDSEQLHDQKLVVDVDSRHDSYLNREVNVVRRYRAAS